MCHKQHCESGQISPLLGQQKSSYDQGENEDGVIQVEPEIKEPQDEQWQVNDAQNGQVLKQGSDWKEVTNQ